MNEVKRIDRIELNNVQRADNGFLTYDFIAAQTGVFPYYDWELGKVVYELKHPDDLLTDAVVTQLDKLPITEDHPVELISVDNAKELIKGMTHNSSRIAGNKLEGNGTVFDAALIGKILNGTKKECSLGLECIVIEESGEYNGQKYDRRQTNFKLNHLAMVSQARCGSECAAKLDSIDNYAVQIRYDEVEQFNNQINNQRSVSTMKIKLDGVEYDIPEVVGSRIQTLEASNNDLTKQVGQLEGKLDGKDDEIKQLKQKNETLEKNQLSAERVDAAVEEKLSILKDAAAVLPEDYDFKGKSLRQIKVDCIKQVSGDEFNADGKSDEYIDARFDTIMDFSKNTVHSSVGENSLIFKGDTSGNKDIDAMRQKRLAMRK